MANKILITEGINNDLDGAAGIVAYAEFLNKTGSQAKAGIIGESHPEAQFALDYLNVKLPEVSDQLDGYQEVRLIDASSPKWISPKININKVIEVIDHRPLNDSHLFPNAKSQVEPVGAAATLIAEKFRDKGIKISKESAWLIYAAIISNTINFKAQVTTSRDRKIANWLKSIHKISDDFIHQMFLHKSALQKSIKETFLDELGSHNFSGHTSCIFQLEIVEAEKFIEKNLVEVQTALKEIQAENHFALLFLSCIDIEKGYNIFVADDKKSQELVSKILRVKFKGGSATNDRVIMRKEINPKVRDYFTKL